VHTFFCLELVYYNSHSVIDTSAELGLLNLNGVPYPEKLNNDYSQKGKTNQNDKNV